MFKKTQIFKSLMVLSISAAPLMASAADPYVGGNFALVDYSVEGVSDASLNALYGRLGTYFGENFSGELRLGTGIADDSVNAEGVEADVKLKEFYGVYLRGGIPLGEIFYPYAVIGYSSGKVEVDGTVLGIGFSESDSESDASFGAGVDFSFNESLKLNLEYMSYFDKDGAELTSFAAGIAWLF
jgi:outer membrane immunogenic protein